MIHASDARTPTCPKCGSLLRRVHSNLGSLFLMCEAKLRNNSGASGPCGQHVHIVGAPEGVCFLIPITKAEFDHLTTLEPRTARDVYRELGLVRRGP